MKKTNRTYAVYVAHEDRTFTKQGNKAEMQSLFEKVKYDYNYVALIKWSTRFNCWDTLVNNREGFV